MDNLRAQKIKLQIRIGGLLLLLTLLSSFVTFATMDERAEAFFLNLSAGFFGSFFTFVILNYFEYQRDKQSKLDQLRLYSDHLLTTLDTAATKDVFANLTYQIVHLSEHIDANNLKRAKELIETQIAMMDYVINLSENNRDLLKYATTVIDQLWKIGFDLGDKDTIELVTILKKKINDRLEGAEFSAHMVDEVKVQSLDTLKAIDKLFEKQARESAQPQQSADSHE